MKLLTESTKILVNLLGLQTSVSTRKINSRLPNIWLTRGLVWVASCQSWNTSMFLHPLPFISLTIHAKINKNVNLNSFEFHFPHFIYLSRNETDSSANFKLKTICFLPTMRCLWCTSCMATVVLAQIIWCNIFLFGCFQIRVWAKSGHGIAD